MKKFICIILSMIIVFSAFSVTSFASYTPKAAKAIKNIDFEKGSILTIADYNENDNIEIYFMGNNVAGEFSVDGMDFKIISAQDSMYMYFTKFPFFYFESQEYNELISTDIFEDFVITDKFPEVYSKTINGTTYTVEKYYSDTEDYLLEFYFLEDELKIIESKDDNFLLRFEFTSEIDEKEFRLPFFAINITPIINFFFGI